MSRLTATILLAILVGFAFFAWHNQAPVTVRLGRGSMTVMPLAEVVLVAMGTGALAVLLIFFVREMRRAVTGFGESRARRRRVRAEEYYQRGVDAHLSGRFELAVDYLTEAQRRDPGYLPAFYRLGVLYRELGRNQEALAIHLKARAQDPRNLRTLMNLADDYEAMGRHGEAIGILREIVAHDDGNRSALRRLREVQEKAQDWEGAIGSCRKLLKLAGKDRSERATLHGLIYRHSLGFLEKGEPGNAVRFLRVVVREDPSFVPARLALGAAEIARGRWREGIEVLRDGYLATRNPVLLEELEDQLIGQENPEELLALHRRFADLFPGDVILTLFYARACLRLEMVDDASQALRRVESSGYDSSLLHALLAEAGYRRQRLRDACEEFRLALEMSWATTPTYKCAVCGHEAEGWEARCPACCAWNTFIIPADSETLTLPTAPRYEGIA